MWDDGWRGCFNSTIIHDIVWWGPGQIDDVREIAIALRNRRFDFFSARAFTMIRRLLLLLLKRTRREIYDERNSGSRPDLIRDTRGEPK